MHDIYQTAHDLARLVSTALPEHPGPRGQYRFMMLPQRLSNTFHGIPTLLSGPQPAVDLLETYDRLVHEWLASLPPDIPNPTRRLKEKFIRGIALDLLLSQLIRISKEPGDDKSSCAVESADVDRAAERHMTPLVTLDLQSSLSQIRLSQTPAAAAVGEGDIQQEKVSDGGPTEAPTPAYGNLAAFATFREPRSMRRNVANLLSHWQLGADPDTYEWQKTSQVLDEGELTEPTTPKHRVHKRRAQRPVVLDPSSQPSTPVAPATRTWGSQPEYPTSTIPLTSSQPTIEESMTQIERGHFGTRDAKSGKIKKKRRAAGF